MLTNWAHYPWGDVNPTEKNSKVFRDKPNNEVAGLLASDEVPNENGAAVVTFATVPTGAAEKVNSPVVGAESN